MNNVANPGPSRPDHWSAHPRLIVVGLVVLCLAPFLNKAVSIDDPLFIWSAKWIQTHPGNFFGSTVNWFGVVMPMHVSNYNPPATSYLLALAGLLFGWSECAMHGVFLLVTIVAALGVYALAKEWCGRPLLATTIALFSPVFLVSSATLMSDIPMFSLWIWAVVMWERGLNPSRPGRLFFASLLMGLAILTKYSALTFLPVLLLLGIVRVRRIGVWLLALVLPLAMLLGYEILTARVYHRGLFSLAREYAAANAAIFEGGLLSKHVIGSVFIGGCLLPVFFFGPMLWRSRRALVVVVICFSCFLALVSSFKQIGPMSLLDGKSHELALIQITLLATAGIHVLALVATEWWQRRDVVTTILSVWILGGLLFATVLNWTISARSLLPIVPAIAILVVRRLERICLPSLGNSTLALPIIPAALIAFAVLVADSSFANSARTAARQLVAQHTPADGQLWFQGHWGFQFYMQELGAFAVDFERSTMQRGDVIVVPANGCNTTFPPAEAVATTEVRDFPLCNWLSTMRLGHSGFYAADWGPLPFAFGLNPPERYYVFKLSQALRFHSPPTDSSQPVIPSREATSGQGPATNFLAVQVLAEQAMEFEKNQRFDKAVARYREALQLAPTSSLLLNNLAWLLASNPDAKLRNGEEAVLLATQAAELTQRQEPIILGTLAAAYAEAGRFDEAVATAQRAIDLATVANQTQLVARNAELLQLYRGRHPYHEPSK